tara:strand:- start:1279 stop:1623 length:345 start_codon:yes stop_codon:yes gene_type:complete
VVVLERSKKCHLAIAFVAPIACGDSQKSQSKARGHAVEKWGKQFFKCHNCGLSKSLGQFLKDMDAELYAEYVNQEYSERHLEDQCLLICIVERRSDCRNVSNLSSLKRSWLKVV